MGGCSRGRETPEMKGWEEGRVAWGSPGGGEELGTFGTWKRASAAKGQRDGHC